MSGHPQVAGKASARINCAGRSYTLRPMMIGMYAEMEAFYLTLKDDPISIAIRALPNIPPERHELVMKAAMDAACRSRLVSAQEMHDFEQSITGTAFKVWCALRSDHLEFKSPADALNLLERISQQETEELLAKLSSLDEKDALGNSSGPTPTQAPLTEGVGPTSTNTFPSSTIGPLNR